MEEKVLTNLELKKQFNLLFYLSKGYPNLVWNSLFLFYIRYQLKSYLMASKIKSLIKSPKFQRKMIFELLSNAIAWAMTLLVTQLLRSFLIVPKLENGFGIFNRKRKVMISGDSFDIISWVIIFVVGLIVFTIVEQYAERFLSHTRFSKEKKDTVH